MAGFANPTGEGMIVGVIAERKGSFCRAREKNDAAAGK
jgi:hypothetical protein